MPLLSRPGRVGTKSIQNSSLPDLCNISRKTWRMKLLFASNDVPSNSYHHFTCVTRHVQITQNNKSAIFFQYLRKEANDEFDFCIQISMKVSYKLIPWFLLGWSSIPKVPVIASLQCVIISQKKKLEMELIFWMQINTKVFCELIFTLWTSKFPALWHYHYLWAWSSTLKVLKVTSLQYV